MWVLVGGGVQQVLHSSWGWRPACAGARLSAGDGAGARAHAVGAAFSRVHGMLDETVQLRVAQSHAMSQLDAHMD